MMPVRTLGLMVITIVLVANTASAQDEPRVGISMGYPAALGVIWHATDRIALRPEVNITRGTTESTITSSLPVISINGVTQTTTTSVTTNDNWQAGIGLSALFYLSRQDALRTYVSPRYAYTRSSSETSPSSFSGSVSGNELRSHFVAGSFGAQYALGRRFSAFGEVGLGYTHTENSPTSAPPGLTFGASVQRTVSTRTGAGVVLYF